MSVMLSVFFIVSPINMSECVLSASKHSQLTQNNYQTELNCWECLNDATKVNVYVYQLKEYLQ